MYQDPIFTAIACSLTTTITKQCKFKCMNVACCGKVDALTIKRGKSCYDNLKRYSTKERELPSLGFTPELQ